MPSDTPREPINWREDLRDLFCAEAAYIMHEVFTEIRDALRDGSINTSRLVAPEVRAMREDIFGDPLQWSTNDEGSEG